MPILRSSRTLTPIIVAVGVFLTIDVAAHACNVPVFRYALEHWSPDPYRVTLFHRGPLADAELELIAPLQRPKHELPVNVALRTVDVGALEDAADQALFASQVEPQLPLLVVQYPQHLHLDGALWAGALNSEAVGRLTESPLRHDIVRRLVDGQSTVWIFVECGDAEKNTAAAALLNDEIKSLPQRLKLPALTDSPEDVLLGGPALRLAFSVLRVRRDDAAERPLVAMLLGSESDLVELNEPLVFPVFGRGRALLPLVGAGISADNVRGTAEFLVGACSCQVKEQNPGFDLLLSADWNTLLSLEGVPLATLGSELSAENGEPELVPIPSGPQTVHSPPETSRWKTPSPEPTPRPRPVWILGGIALLVSVVLIAIRRR